MLLKKIRPEILSKGQNKLFLYIRPDPMNVIFTFTLIPGVIRDGQQTRYNLYYKLYNEISGCAP